jgi:hypothetical protein
MRRPVLIALLAVTIPSRLLAALDCYNTSCLPFVKKLDHARQDCPKEFRAKNYETFCAETGLWIYGGLSFYDGEGMTGTGGLLRLDKKSRTVAVRRLPILRDVSINSIAADGNVVWFGTTRHQECDGEPFVHGLVRYDWATREVKTYEGSDDGPIGFVINDLLLDEHSLWAATDLGISRLDRDSNTWHHYTPAKKERSAKEILEDLLRKTPRDCLRSENFENELVEGLAKFRPKLLASYLQSVTPEQWQCPELRFLAARVPDFATLDRQILRFHPPGSRWFSCVVAGFITAKHVEPEWRGMLVAAWKKKPDSFAPEAFRFFRGDMEIAQMLIGSRYRAVAVVPQILGEQAIPMLAKKLKESGGLDLAAIVYALEAASHQRISPDGRVENLASPGTVHEFLERSWFEWSATQRDAVVAAWSRHILRPHAEQR